MSGTDIWDSIGWENLIVGRRLRLDRRWRSSISRSYYAVFSIVVGRLEGRVRLQRRMLTPRHEELPHLIRRHMTQLAHKDRLKLSTLVIRLRAARIRADYNRHQLPERRETVECCSMAAVAFRMLGVNHG